LILSLAQLVPVLLAVHIVLAIALLVPSLLLPFTMRSRSGAADPPPGRFSRGMYRLQRNGTLVIAAGLALTGICLVAALGTQLFSQAWLLLALGLYAANLLLAFFVQRPGVARLLRLRGETSDSARVRWTNWARRQRYVSYVMAGLVGAIAFLMMTKPGF
jgi:Predicted integral membrane protein (DUF2269)